MNQDQVWRKSGCKNCGSLSHNARDCLEKPRKVAYKYREETTTNKTIHKSDVSDDEDAYVRDDTNDWDAKRDRWRGYDPVNDYDKQLKLMKQEEKKKETEMENEDLDEDELEEMRELGLLDEINKNEKHIKLDNPLASNDGAKLSVRSLDEKARYLEVIKTGEELRFNPKSRVYKDLKEGFLNERGQFIPYLSGEAEKFERLKQFTTSVQHDNREKWELEGNRDKPVTDMSFSAEVSPTALMLSMEQKKKDNELVRKAKRKELLEKYGALGESKE
ncbi:unnamed protein product [Ambrosiozyma monospora]|uniref:Pre-mRNA-splicing factor SLU7 n=1 Tax=Ambrosiozyma monospora TaxID=43982 RepID=A0A9W6Z193_AMBMO|nr:unnamed protein product [Ambrosiozyma monospora]